ncbi:MAG: hypothetical protein EOM54_11295 [Clostridia bacterium]|nr:hypothetical protein [Clostridia bacterium]
MNAYIKTRDRRRRRAGKAARAVIYLSFFGLFLMSGYNDNCLSTLQAVIIIAGLLLSLAGGMYAARRTDDFGTR